MDDHKDVHVDSCATDIRKDHTTSDSAHEDNNIGVIHEHHVECAEEESHHEDIKTDSYEHRDIHVVSCATETSKDHTPSDSGEDDNNGHVIEEHLAECRAAELHHEDVKGDMDGHKDIYLDSCTNDKYHIKRNSVQEDTNIVVYDEHHVECVEEESHHEYVNADTCDHEILHVELHTYDHKYLHVDSGKSDIGGNHNTSYSAQEESNIEVIDEHNVECIAKGSHHNEVDADTHMHKGVHVVGCSADISPYHTTSGNAQEDNNREVIYELLLECRAEELHHEDVKADTHEHKDTHVDSCTTGIRNEHSCESTFGKDVTVSIEVVSVLEESDIYMVDAHIVEDFNIDYLYEKLDLHDIDMDECNGICSGEGSQDDGCERGTEVTIGGINAEEESLHGKPPRNKGIRFNKYLEDFPLQNHLMREHSAGIGDTRMEHPHSTDFISNTHDATIVEIILVTGVQVHNPQAISEVTSNNEVAGDFSGEYVYQESNHDHHGICHCIKSIVDTFMNTEGASSEQSMHDQPTPLRESSIKEETGDISDDFTICYTSHELENGDSIEKSLESASGEVVEELHHQPKSLLRHFKSLFTGKK